MKINIFWSTDSTEFIGNNNSVTLNNHFSTWEGHRSSSTSRSRNISQFSATSDIFPAPHQEGTNKVRDIVTLPVPCLNSGPLSSACNHLTTRLANLSWNILVMCPNHVAGISLFKGEVARQFGFYKFNSCAFLSKVSRCEFLGNILSFLLVLEIELSVISQDSWPQTRIRTKTNLQIASFAAFEGSWFCDHETITLTQNCVCLTNYQAIYQPPCSAFWQS